MNLECDEGCDASPGVYGFMDCSCEDCKSQQRKVENEYADHVIENIKNEQREKKKNDDFFSAIEGIFEDE